MGKALKAVRLPEGVAFEQLELFDSDGTGLSEAVPSRVGLTPGEGEVILDRSVSVDATEDGGGDDVK